MREDERHVGEIDRDVVDEHRLRILEPDPSSRPGAGAIAARLKTFWERSTGSSNRIARAIVLEEPPSLDAGEMTDKGSINQRAVLASRAALVEELYRDPPSARVLVVG
ncbi:MAG: hypothetical protein ACT4P3_00590 [Betaproteobacteria bacterium]